MRSQSVLGRKRTHNRRPPPRHWPECFAALCVNLLGELRSSCHCLVAASAAPMVYRRRVRQCRGDLMRAVGWSGLCLLAVLGLLGAAALSAQPAMRPGAPPSRIVAGAPTDPPGMIDDPALNVTWLADANLKPAKQTSMGCAGQPERDHGLRNRPCLGRPAEPTQLSRPPQLDAADDADHACQGQHLRQVQRCRRRLVRLRLHRKRPRPSLFTGPWPQPPADRGACSRQLLRPVHQCPAVALLDGPGGQERRTGFHHLLV